MRASRHLLPSCAAVLALAGAIGLQRALLGIHGSWSSVYGHFAHGYLVLAMSIWLGWQAWRGRAGLRIQPWWPAFAALAVLLLALVVSMQLGVETLVESLVPAILLATVAGAFGLPLAGVLLWPILFLYCAMPAWWVLNAPMQALTTAIVNPLVRLSGASAYIQGYAFHFPSGVIEIGSLCSGLNYTIAAISLTLFQGMLYLPGWRSRLKLVAAGVAVSLLANWVRVYSLMLVGYFSQMQNYLIRVEHIYYGWVLFMLFMWPVFLYGARLESAARRQGAIPSRAPPAPGAITATHPPATLVATGLAAVLLLLPGLFRSGVASMALHAAMPPLGAPGDSSTGLVVGLADAVAVKGALEDRGSLYTEGYAVEFYRARYRLGDSGPDAGSALGLLPARWRAAGKRERGHSANGLVWEQQRGRVSDRPVLVRSGLAIAGTPVIDARGARRAALQGLLRLRGDGQLWFLAVACQQPDCAAEEHVLEAVVMRHSPSLVTGR